FKMKRKGSPLTEENRMETSDSSRCEEQESAEKSKRSKQKDQTPATGDGVVRPLKLSKGELYKAPTVEELSQLKEAESLFHCSLLKMQMDELLKEVALSERRKKLVDSFVQKITALLQSVPDSPVVELTDLSWLEHSGIAVPFILLPEATKGKFHMEPPVSVDLIGSYPLGTCIKPRVSVDLAVTIPPSILHPMDGINQRYSRKKALYLAGLAQHLSSSSSVGTLRYSCLHGNRLHPLLIVTPSGKESSSTTLRIHALPPPDYLQPSRFKPQRNNVRTAWFTGQDSQQGNEPPTPHYNSAVLADLLPCSHLHFLSAHSVQCPAYGDAVALLKVWLRQRELDQGAGCFGGFLAAMLLAYLLSTHKVGKTMNAYQFLRNALHFLATTDLTESGITLANNPDSKAPSLPEFHSAFQVVFVDPSGHLNMCADMTACTYKQIQYEASLSLKFWDDPTVEGFQTLLMTPKPMIRAYDNVYQLSGLVKMQASCKKLSLLGNLMDHSGNYVLAVLPFILSLLQKGLGDRVHLLTHSLPPDPEWPVRSRPPKHKDQPPLAIGLLLNLERALSVLTGFVNFWASDFRQLWGSRSELRRFQDGAITEAVLWPGSSVCQRRRVPLEVITHLLELHAGIPKSCVRFVGEQVADLIRVGKDASGTGEEESLKVVQSFDDLSRKLWQLEGLPLSITSVQGAHPALRYTQVFPPVPVKLIYSFFNREKSCRALVPKENKPCPYYITPIKVICHMEGSGKWPNDSLAIRHIKAAFHVRLGELLKAQHNYTSRPSPAHLDVWKDGLVFRIEVAYHREPQVLRESVTPEGMLIRRDNPEAQRVELETQHKPFLTSTLHGLQQQHPGFGAVCRLAKRWLAAQLFGGDVGEEATELLVASLFLQPAPFSPPSSPQVGLLRFLYLLATFDWKNSPLVVNLNSKLTAAEHTEIKNRFMSSRESLPVMFIATPNDETASVWTKEGPSVQMLQRIVTVAAKSLHVLETQFMDPSQKQDIRVVFRPPLDIYDVLIHLRPKQVPLMGQSVDPKFTKLPRGAREEEAVSSGGAFPVVDFDPVKLYLSELKDAFGDVALFFYDPHGGTVIAVLWKPKTFHPQPFKTSLMNARQVNVTDAATTVPNVEAIVRDFHVMGEGLVNKVELKTETWAV
uniref:Nucleolar protein 6 n=1 Tax=Electrophorus electricus TaxID=8005 RepID=A0AAY5ELP3_ELEEL